MLEPASAGVWKKLMIKFLSVQLLSLFNVLQHAHGWMSIRELVVTSGIGSVKNLGLRCELDCLLYQTVIQDGGPDLQHAMSSLRRPAHLPSLVHSCIDQLIDRALGS